MQERIKGAYEKLLRGGAGVPVGELEKFADLARRAAKAQASGHAQAVKGRIGKQADHFGIPRDLIFEDFEFNFGGATPPAPSAPASGQTRSDAPVRVSSPTEAKKLPPGTLFVTPDGRTMRVPGR